MNSPSPVLLLKLSENEIRFLGEGVELLLNVAEDNHEDVASALWRDILAKLRRPLKENACSPS